MLEFANLNPMLLFLMFTTYLIIFTITTVLLYKNRMSKKISIALLFISVTISGFILGGIPNPVMPIQQIFIGISSIIQGPSLFPESDSLFLPMMLFLLIFLISTIFFGRIICSHVCPLGAAQELISKVTFKTSKEKKKYLLNPSSKVTNMIRIIFFFIMVLSTLFFGIAILYIINPFAAFSVFSNISNIDLLIIPIIFFSAIMISSLFIYRPWCRLFCPFGMLAWITSRFSKFKLRRNEKCTNCKACEKVCPTNEAFLTSNKSECYECYRCIDACSFDAIEYKKDKRKKCPTEEVNPNNFTKPIKVKIQSALFPIISKVKKMPPQFRRWNYSTSSWEILGSPPGMKPMGMKPTGAEFTKMKPTTTKTMPVKPMGMKTPMPKPGEAKPMGVKPTTKRPTQMKPMGMKPMGAEGGKKIKKLYNCIHCNRCRTSESRIKLKQRMFDRGQVPEDFEDLFHSYEKFETPLNQNIRRIREFDNIPKESSTLLYLGCFSSIKVPKFAEHAIEYLLKQEVDFTILEKEICCGLSLKISGEKKLFEQLKNKNLEIFKQRKFKTIICICPACYNMFRKHYKKSGFKIKYITEYLKPLDFNNSPKYINIQHSCHLLYEGKKKLTKQIDKILNNSGFRINKTPHWCCGGGMGQIYITDTIKKIGKLRVKDFKEKLLTTYCPSCYWMLKVYGKQEKTKYKLKDIYELLMDKQ
ncbi:MAG: heterodisulfide reductase-related iron-sulfur binding cluster [Candidatus Helarchaeota archaeon]